MLFKLLLLDLEQNKPAIHNLTELYCRKSMVVKSFIYFHFQFKLIETIKALL